MMIPSLLSAIAWMASSISSPYALEFHLRGNTTRTVFMASPGMAAAGSLPVLRICYERSASSPAPASLGVILGERHQLLSPGECSFFSAEQVDLAVWKGDGTLRASVTLQR